jgi:hypothetical protein
MLKQGWKLGGDNKMMWLTKDGNTMVFDVAVNPNKGMLCCMCIKRKIKMANSTVSDPKPVSMTVQEARDNLGHGGEETTRKATKAFGWEHNKVGLKPCVACAGKEKEYTKGE